jgi:hypothetical protein
MDSLTRDLVRRRAAGRCEYCHLPEAAIEVSFHIEHVVARQHGGDDDAENLALACDRCNLYKGPNLSSLDPDTGGVTPLFHPRRNPWSQHFRFEGPKIEGITEVGRATVRLLQMNDSRRLQLREEFGVTEEPPD